MAIKMTPEEMEAYRTGNKSIQDIIKARGQDPKPAEDKPKKTKSELDKVKAELKQAYIDQTNLLKVYKEIKKSERQNINDKINIRSVIATLKFRKQTLIAEEKEKKI